MSAASSARKAAKYAKQTRNAARVTAVATVVTARDQRKMMRADQSAAMVPPPPMLPAGWYPDAADPQFVVWWGPNNFGSMQWFPESRRHYTQLQPQAQVPQIPR